MSCLPSSFCVVVGAAATSHFDWSIKPKNKEKTEKLWNFLCEDVVLPL
jgi:hypothetical protein